MVRSPSVAYYLSGQLLTSLHFSMACDLLNEGGGILSTVYCKATVIELTGYFLVVWRQHLRRIVARTAI